MRAFERTTADDCVAAGVRLSIELQTWPRCLPAQPVEENALRWLWPAAVPTVCSRHFLRAPLLPGSYEAVVFSTSSGSGTLVAALPRAVRVEHAAGQPTSDAARSSSNA